MVSWLKKAVTSIVCSYFFVLAKICSNFIVLIVHNPYHQLEITLAQRPRSSHVHTSCGASDAKIPHLPHPADKTQVKPYPEDSPIASWNHLLRDLPMRKICTDRTLKTSIRDHPQPPIRINFFPHLWYALITH